MVRLVAVLPLLLRRYVQTLNLNFFFLFLCFFRFLRARSFILICVRRWRNVGSSRAARAEVALRGGAGQRKSHLPWDYTDAKRLKQTVDGRDSPSAHRKCISLVVSARPHKRHTDRHTKLTSSLGNFSRSPALNLGGRGEKVRSRLTCKDELFKKPLPLIVSPLSTTTRVVVSFSKASGCFYFFFLNAHLGVGIIRGLINPIASGFRDTWTRIVRKLGFSLPTAFIGFYVNFPKRGGSATGFFRAWLTPLSRPLPRRIDK